MNAAPEKTLRPMRAALAPLPCHPPASMVGHCYVLVQGSLRIEVRIGERTMTVLTNGTDMEADRKIYMPWICALMDEVAREQGLID